MFFCHFEDAFSACLQLHSPRGVSPVLFSVLIGVLSLALVGEVDIRGLALHGESFGRSSLLRSERVVGQMSFTAFAKHISTQQFQDNPILMILIAPGGTLGHIHVFAYHGSTSRCPIDLNSAG
ncbi:hypothetical protein ACRALDRAFT_206748 [Sodiomyces alcalophilus JCM 7366]|uniref:uncharacterized protein n=1 Tax=Sodiomyces alcalophilus JCM 7366 TaxID=591952 RepID=UPI0039B538C3